MHFESWSRRLQFVGKQSGTDFWNFLEKSAQIKLVVYNETKLVVF